VTATDDRDWSMLGSQQTAQGAFRRWLCVKYRRQAGAVVESNRKLLFAAFLPRNAL